MSKPPMSNSLDEYNTISPRTKADLTESHIVASKEYLEVNVGILSETTIN